MMRMPNLSGQQLELLFESFPGCLCLLHPEGRFIKANPAFLNFSGYSNRELFSQAFIQYIHPEDQQTTLDSFSKMRSGSEAHTFENRFKVKNSDYKWLMWNCYTLPGNGLYYCSATDISGQKKVEAAFPQSSDTEKPTAETTFVSPATGTDDKNARYRRWMDNIIENYTDGFFTLSTNWTVIAFNQMAQRMVNLPKRSIIDANFWSLFPVGSDHQLYREARRSLDNKQTVHFEEFYPHLNKWLEITAYPDNDTVTLFFKDTTSRKQQELSVQHLAQDYKILFANNPLPMWAYDLDELKIVMVNNAALSLYGYTRKEFLALDLYDLRPDSEHQRLKEELKNRDAYSNLKLSSEWLHKKKDGTTMYVDIASHQIKLNDHRARLIVANNITERRKAEDKLMTQNKQLREIAQLSSHDLRGPVASMLGLVSLFDKSNVDVNLNKQIIQHLEVCAKDMDKVIHTIVKKTYEEGV